MFSAGVKMISAPRMIIDKRRVILAAETVWRPQNRFHGPTAISAKDDLNFSVAAKMILASADIIAAAKH